MLPFKGKVLEWIVDKLAGKFIDFQSPDEFFQSLEEDLSKAEKEVIIFSPYVKEPGKRDPKYFQVFGKLLNIAEKGVKVKIVIKPGQEKNLTREDKENFKKGRIEVWARDTHAKAVLIDGKILYLGSLNVLSYWEKEDIMVKLSGLEWGPGILPRLFTSRTMNKLRPPGELPEDKKII